MNSGWRHPDALVGTDWLAANLDTAGLRVFDCTTYLIPREDTAEAPYDVRSGRPDYDRSHIPGAGFIDIQGALSDNGTKLRFMRLDDDALAAAFARHGIGDDSRVVLYSAGSIMWATRVWWLLRAIGFDNAAILDGGWEKWRDEARATSTEPCPWPPATLTPRPRANLIVDRDIVRGIVENGGATLLNSLNRSFYLGDAPSRYGRPGRIPGSRHLFSGDLIAPETRTFIAPDAARERVETAGLAADGRVVAYCGGGISATIDLFVLHQLGFDDLGLYDGSMGEWARRAELPMEQGVPGAESGGPK